MDGELRWFAGLLGEVRDCEVQQARFIEALDGIADNLILGPVKTRIRQDLQAVALPARSRVAEAMESPRYLAVMAVLRRWRAEPPVLKDITTAHTACSRRPGAPSAKRIGGWPRRSDPARHRAACCIAHARPPSAPATPPNCANRWKTKPKPGKKRTVNCYKAHPKPAR